MIEGMYSEQYSRFWDYCQELKNTKRDENGQDRFKRFYLDLGAIK